MTQEQLQAEFDKLKAAIFTIPGYQIVTEPVIDLEYNTVICTIQYQGKWAYTANIWLDRCAHCGHSCVQYDLYTADQAEESDPDPIMETDNIEEIITYLKG
jgi:hypothetical protein